MRKYALLIQLSFLLCFLGVSAPDAHAQWAFEETFDADPASPSQDMLPRTLDYVTTHRRDSGGILVDHNYSAFPADHGHDCAGPDPSLPNSQIQHQADTSHLTNGTTDIDQSFFICKNHMMSSVGQVAGYSVTSFWPKQQFNFEDGGVLEFDSNINNDHGRHWFEVMIVPHYQLKVGAAIDWLPISETYPEKRIVFWLGLLDGNSYRRIGIGSGGISPNGWQIDQAISDDWSVYYPNDPALRDRRIRRKHRITIQNNQITWGIQKEDGTFDNRTLSVPQGLPFHQGLVVFKTHSYTPDKAIPSNTNKFTFHWDNIRFDGPVVGRYENFESPGNDVVKMHANGNVSPGTTQTKTINLPHLGPNSALFGQIQSPRIHHQLLSINGSPFMEVEPIDYGNGTPCTSDGWKSFYHPIDPSLLRVGENTFTWKVGPRPSCMADWQWTGFAVKAFEVQFDLDEGAEPVPTFTPTPTFTPGPPTPTSLPADISTGLVAYYPFNEGQGTTTADQTGTQTVATLNNVAWTQQGKYSTGLSFNGGGQVETGTWNVNGSGLTISAWINPNNLTGDERIVSKATGVQEQDHLFMVSSTNGGRRLRFRLKTNGNTTTLIAPSDTLSSNQWFHVVARYDGSTMKLYQDGIEIASTSKTGTITQSTAQLWIGGAPGSSDGGTKFKGVIDDVRIYSRALSTEEIAQLFTGSTGGNSPVINSVVPNSASNDEIVVPLTVGGSEFRSGAILKLAASGKPDIQATGVTVVSGNSITGNVNLNGVSTGLYDVVVMNSDGTSDSFASGFMVNQGAVILTPTPTPTIPAGGSGTSFVVEAGETSYAFTDELRGVAHANWEHAWGKPFAGAVPGLATIYEAADVGLIRYAGGLWANYVGWERLPQRTPYGNYFPNPANYHSNFAGQIKTGTAYNHHYGTNEIDSLAQLAAAIDAEVMIQVNVVNNDPAMWADMVHYTNVEKNYDFKYWELGNEFDIDSGLGISPHEYANRVAAYIDTMKAVDPSIVIVGGVPGSAHDGPRQGYNDAVTEMSQYLSRTAEITSPQGRKIDSLSWHWYQDCNNASVSNITNWQFGGLATNSWRNSYSRVWSQIGPSRIQNEIIHPHIPNATQGVTELNYDACDFDDAPQENNHMVAVWAADVMGRLAYNGVDYITWYEGYGSQNQGYPFVASTTDIPSSPDQLFLRPVYYTEFMYGNFFGDRLLSVNTPSPDKVSVWASKEEDEPNSLKLMVVNIGATSATVNIGLQDFTATSGKKYVLSNPNPTNMNSNSGTQNHGSTINGVSLTPNTVSGSASQLRSAAPAVSIQQNTVVETLPAYSVMAIELVGTYSSSEPSPTPSVSPISAPTVSDAVPREIYASSFPISGTKASDTAVWVNDLEVISQNSSTTWSYSPTWNDDEYGTKELRIKLVRGSTESEEIAVMVKRHGLGDITGDGVVDVFDLGIFASSYNMTVPTEAMVGLRMSDMNSDGVVNVFDLGIFASRYNSNYQY